MYPANPSFRMIYLLCTLWIHVFTGPSMYPMNPLSWQPLGVWFVYAASNGLLPCMFFGRWCTENYESACARNGCDGLGCPVANRSCGRLDSTRQSPCPEKQRGRHEWVSSRVPRGCSRCISLQWHHMSIIAPHVSGKLFVRQFVQGNNKGIIKALDYMIFLRGTHCSPVDLPYKGPIMWKAFPCHIVIMSKFATTLHQ